MTPLLLALALTAGAERKADSPQTDGKWLIVYAEEGGHRQNTWEQRVATVKGHTLSYGKDGESRTLHLTFGPHQTLKASTKSATDGSGEENQADKEKQAEKSMSGVYILGQDYLCISLE